MDYPRHHTIDHYLNKVRVHTEPYTAEILGKEIIIFPNVMSPKYDRSSKMFLQMMPTQNNLDILEVGSGTGIISLFLASNNNVTALDINPAAVTNTKTNFIKNNLNGNVLESNLFENVSSKFDTIIFNAPFHGNKANDVLELGTSDYNYQTLTRFFEQVTNYLKPSGEILLGFANTGDNNLVRNLIQDNQFVVKELKTQENGDWVMYLYRIIHK